MHLTSAVLAGLLTATATNPLWVVKTRLQLITLGTSSRNAQIGALQCAKDVWRFEGPKGFYRGLSASYLGIVESTIQWVLYEHLRGKTIKQKSGPASSSSWALMFAAGLAKSVATLLTYPHEVVRTRLRQPPGQSGVLKYKGILQAVRLIVREEGFRALYGGFLTHLVRILPKRL